MEDSVCSAVGLSTDEALNSLISLLQSQIVTETHRLRAGRTSRFSRWRGHIMSSLHHSHQNVPWTFCGTYVLFSLLIFFLLLVSSLAQDTVDYGQLLWSLFILLLIIANMVLSCRLRLCKSRELLWKCARLLEKLKMHRKRLNRRSHAGLECPDLFSPTSECIHLEWTYRDGILVNLPWILLVPGDVIQIRPGRQVPAKCIQYSCHNGENGRKEFVAGDVYWVKEQKDPRTGGVWPFSPLLCEVVAAPLVDYVSSIFQNHHRPGSAVDMEFSKVLHRVIERIILPAALVISLILAVARMMYFRRTSGSQVDLLLTFPALTLLPLAGISFPLLFFVLNCNNLVALMKQLDNDDQLDYTESSLESLYSTQLFANDVDKVTNPKKRSLIHNWRRLFTCDPKHLPLTANLVHTLGTVTNVCVVDKKGLLSWPNPTPERIFFLRPPKDMNLNQDLNGQLASAVSLHANVRQEVLDLTHECDSAFGCHFDDPQWTRFSESLKPIGLNIQLNCCDLNKEYVRFLDHVTVISATVPRTIAVVNRRCCCQLASVLGFSPLATQQFKLHGSTHSRVLAAYKKEAGEFPLPGLVKHRTPLAHLFATVSEDTRSVHSHVMCQGTADMLLDSCSHYWDGYSTQNLNRSQRRKITDFYNRHSMTSYCVGFSYKPMRNVISDTLGNQYIDWPLENKFNKHNTHTLSKAISESSLLLDDFASQDCAQSVDECIENALSKQVFLGLITMQYQAKGDVVKVVEQLDKACIRFVHFSKENELRSRVFAEKLGLEAGWNCHVSLASRGSMDGLDGSGVKPMSPGTSVRNSYLFSDTISDQSVPSHFLSRRNSLPWDLKIELPSVKFGGVMQASPSPAPIADDDDSVFDEKIDVMEEKQQEEKPLLSQATSCTSLSSNARESSGLYWNWNDKSRLPVGVEHVRPHLEQVDNVPLLVSLFTDCAQSSTKEMLRIMQEYGEVVLVVGSSLSVSSGGIFSSANASISVVPLQPAPCCRQPPSVAAKDTSAVHMASQLLSLPCSLSLSAGQQLNLLPMIALCRHKLASTRAALIFLLQSCLLLSGIQILNLVLMLPPLFDVSQLMLWTCLTLPLLCATISSSPLDVQDSLRLTTPKNHNWVANKVLKLFVQSFVARFVPTLVFVVALYGFVLRGFCRKVPDSDCFLHIDRNITDYSSGTWSEWMGDYKVARILAKHLSTFFLTLYLCAISSGFVNYRQYVFQWCPVRNLCWLFMCVVSLLMQVVYYLWEISVDRDGLEFRFGQIDWLVHIVGFVWLVPLLVINELFKWHELTIYRRDQRRRRLSFGTKLGMNSPY